MKKAKAAAFAIVTGLMVSGCISGKTSTFPPQQDAVYVTRDGRLYTALTESYDPSDTGYNAEELKAMASEEAAGYNEVYGVEGSNEPVIIAECMVEEGNATIVYQYTTAEDLCRFTDISQDTANHPESLVMSTNSISLTEEDAQRTWTDARKSNTTDLETVMKKKDLPMVIVTGTVTIQTEGRILYYSGAVNLKDEFTAQVTEGTAYIVFR
ncbi:MAG: hypothetical protein HFG68_01690 [Hungatella sp.]|nr:hypothetical protein [Hungatella sp.]